MKKKLAFLSMALAAVFAVGALAACTPRDDVGPGGDDGTTPGSVEAYMPSWSGRVNESAEVAVHDPSVFRDPADGTYYALGSHFAVASSADLINWEQVASDNDYAKLYGENVEPLEDYPAWPTALKETLELVKPNSDTKTTWAPDVEYYDGTYYMYYSLTSGFGSRNSAIGRVESNRVMGPYSNNTIIVDSMGGSGDDPNAIDPELFYDKDGGLWMVYGSFFGGIYIKELYNEGDQWGLPKEEGYGKRIWGTSRSNMEGPFVFYNEDTGYYYLMTSHGDLNTNYNMRVARSENPDGPYVDMFGNDVAGNREGGVKLAGNIVIGSDNGYAAIGHNSVIKIEDEPEGSGDRYIVVTHVRRQAGSGVTAGHNVYTFQLYFNEDGWPVMNPNRYADEVIGTGIEDEDILGDYDLVLHNYSTVVDFAVSETYTIAADGVITKDGGNVGTWERSGDYYITLTIDEVEYKGVVTPSIRMYERDKGMKYPTYSITAVSETQSPLWAVGTFECY